MAIVVVVVELFLTVFLGLVVEEVEQAKGLELELSDQTRTFKLALIGLRLAAVSPRSQLYYSTEYCTRLEVAQCPDVSLSPSWTISLFYLFFTVTDSESYTVDDARGYKTGALIIVLQVEYIQLEQVKYDHRQKYHVVIDDR